MSYLLAEAGSDHTSAAAYSFFVCCSLWVEGRRGEGGIRDIFEVVLTDNVQEIGSPLYKVGLVQLW